MRAGINLFNNSTIYSGNIDPSVTGFAAAKGDVYVSTLTGMMYQNADGTSLAWNYMILSSEKGANNGVATLDGGGKVPLSQLPASLLEYKGSWNAATNTPTLVNGTGVSGYTYICNVGGTVNFGAGPLVFIAGDWVVYDGTIWERVINSNLVVSVNGQTGVVVLTTTNIAEGTNLYYTDARAQASITGGASSIVTANLGTSKALVSDGSGKVAVAAATTSTEIGYVNGVTSSIQTQLNGKQATGNYVTALTGDVTATGPGSVAATLATVNTNVGSFGSATQVPAYTVNAKGLTTAASNISIQIAESQVTNLVSDLAGKQPTGNYLTSLTGDITASGPGAGASTLATVNANVGSFGSATQVAAHTVNAKGLVTAASNVSIQIAESQVTNLVSDLAAKQGTVTIGALDAQAVNANGLALVTNVLSAQSADGTHPGMVNIAAQTFGGSKTFNNPLFLSNGTAPLPALAFASDPTTGLYRIGASDMGFTLGGAMGMELVNIGSSLINFGIGAAAPGTSGSPGIFSRTLNNAAAWQFINPSTGTGASTVLGVYAGVSSNVLSLENLAASTASYVGGGSLIRSNGNQTQLIISSEFASAFTAFTIGGTALANEKMRLTATNLALNSGVTHSMAGSSSGVITIQPQAAAGTYNFNLPITVGSAGQVLTSQAGGSTAMTWSSVLSNPMTTGGDIIYGDASGNPVRLANGSSTQVLTSSGGTAAPTWTTISGANPTGTIISFAGNTAPTGYLIADGSLISRTTFATLFAAIGTAYGVGDASTTFQLPDMRGFFPRGVSLGNGAAADPDTASRLQHVSGTFTLVGSTIGTSVVTVSSTANLAPGMTITGTNIPANTVVQRINNSTQFVLGNLLNSATVSATGSTGGLTFTFGASAVGNYVGSVQASTFAAHNHGFLTSTSAGSVAPSTTNFLQQAPSGGGGFMWGPSATIVNTAEIQVTGSSAETRGVNLYLLYCIKT